MRRHSVAVAMVTALALGGVSAPALATGGGGGHHSGPKGHCARADSLRVPGAELQKVDCLRDLTTAGTTVTGHTDPSHYSGLHAPGTVNPSGVAGIQIDGYFPDTSTGNTTHGWNHDSQFVIRLPDKWNGGLVITGAPGNRGQYANDHIIADTVLAKGYAFASTDKGNTGERFYDDGDEPGDAVAEWNERVTQLTVATKKVAKQRYRSTPKRTYLFGISNGGYLVRWQLENRPWLYDGGVDWEGTLFSAEAPMFNTLPAALRHYPQFAAGDEQAHEAMVAAGWEPGTEYLWPFHYQYYWDPTQRWYREEFDPEFDGDLDAGIPFCASGTPNCDADYDFATRPPQVHEAVAKVALTGDLRKPLITLHGTHDALLPIRATSDAYAELVRDEGKTRLHRYYRIENGTHIDSLYPVFPDTIRPILPCARTAFDSLEKWTDTGKGRWKKKPPPSATLERPDSGDLLNTCSLSNVQP